MKTHTTSWQDLRVSPSDGDGDDLSLGEMVQSKEGRDVLDHYAVIHNGEITDFTQSFLSAPGEAPDWNTPRGDVDWVGFEDALAAAREPSAVIATT